MIKTKAITLRGREFKLTQMTAGQQLRLLPSITELASGLVGRAAPVLAAFVQGSAADADGLFGALPSVESVGALIAAKLPADQLDSLRRTLLEKTLVKPLDGSPEQLLLPIFDVEMAGEMMCVCELLWEAIRFNYEDFSNGLTALVRKAVVQAALNSKESRTSPAGQSGG